MKSLSSKDFNAAATSEQARTECVKYYEKNGVKLKVTMELAEDSTCQEAQQFVTMFGFHWNDKIEATQLSR